MKLSLDEIKDWKEFEDLISDYFDEIADAKENNLIEVDVKASGEGSDGGRDILLKFRVNDSIETFERIWVVQCKFYSKSVSKKQLNTVNIPSLIHEYAAHGYLLVCKNGVTSKVSEMFESLNEKCRFDYKYVIWDGNKLISNILVRKKLRSKFFPEYTNYLEAKKKA